MALALGLAPVAGCYLHHGTEPTGPCGGFVVDDVPRWELRPLADDEPALELVGEPERAPATVYWTSALVRRGDGLALFSSRPELYYQAVDATFAPVGEPVMVAGEASALSVAVLGDRFAVSYGGRSSSTIDILDGEGRPIASSTERWRPAAHVAAAGSACFSVADRDWETGAARLTFVGTDARTIVGPHALTGGAINNPISVTVGPRTVAIWHETRRVGGRLMLAQAFEGGVAAGPPASIEGALFEGLMQAEAVGERIAVIGLNDSPPYRLRLTVLDPDDLGSTVGREVERSNALYRASVVAVVPFPEADAVVVCTNIYRRGGDPAFAMHVVGLDGRQLGAPLAVERTSLGDCVRVGDDVVGIGGTVFDPASYVASTVRARLTLR